MSACHTHIVGYSDANWVGCPTDRRFTYHLSVLFRTGQQPRKRCYCSVLQQRIIVAVSLLRVVLMLRFFCYLLMCSCSSDYINNEQNIQFVLPLSSLVGSVFRFQYFITFFASEVLYSQFFVWSSSISLFWQSQASLKSQAFLAILLPFFTFP